MTDRKLDLVSIKTSSPKLDRVPTLT